MARHGWNETPRRKQRGICLTDGLTRQLKYFRPKGRGINLTRLKHNGYILTKGNQLKDFKLQFAHLIDKANKTRQLGLFNFRALLNLSMLLVESEAKIKDNSLTDKNGQLVIRVNDPASSS
ncbi:MAG: hypothetical protein M0Q51_03345 [Bacteroidales bacterium]|nr:hypothetical protein [Bacteroidales bacterium]